jgi:hypothetical protein
MFTLFLSFSDPSLVVASNGVHPKWIPSKWTFGAPSAQLDSTPYMTEPIFGLEPAVSDPHYYPSDNQLHKVGDMAQAKPNPMSSQYKP